MSFKIIHSIGLANAWWFLIIYAGIMIIQPYSYPNGKEVMKRLTTQPERGKFERISGFFGMILYFGSLFYSILLPLPLTSINFIIGTVIFSISMIIYFTAVHNYATTPFNEPVTKGIYKISRNPIHFFSYISWIGVGIAAGSWILIICNFIMMIHMHIGTLSEEKFCIEKYGDSYKEYMERVPRYFLFF
jgi:protein-S-isoprenylcysteine O-methyltransferase Ste14